MAHAEIAQLVEHTTENCGVASPILALGTPNTPQGVFVILFGKKLC